MNPVWKTIESWKKVGCLVLKLEEKKSDHSDSKDFFFEIEW